MASNDRYDELLKAVASSKQKNLSSEKSKSTRSDSDKIAFMRNKYQIPGRTILYCRIRRELKQGEKKNSQLKKDKSSNSDENK